jgi:sirohydrochlorin ferrochelatase
LVRDSDVEAAFGELKDEYEKNDFVRSNCHQLTHVIGRAAAERYGDIPSAYSRGVHFCGTGYYHGVMEAVVARIGADEVLEEADTLCAELREREPRSDYHYACAHGLGHGFMAVLENELFDSLKACDALTDGWERDECYGGVFMENVMAEDNPSHPTTKYLRADQPLYPCPEVETRYREKCYPNQVSYALKVQGGSVAKVLDVCATAEDEGRAVCYRALGTRVASRGIQKGTTVVDQTKLAKRLCGLAQGYEARSDCFLGVASELTYRLDSDTQAKAFCESFKKDADLRARCLWVVEEHLKGKS